MESKLNYFAIEKYSKTFSENLANSVFSDKSYITGSEILNLFELKQVNLFILQYIFENWKKGMDSMKSPYFDYDNGKVQEALSGFMNLLSQNIKIKKEDFQPLLLQSVKDTILLICSPYDYYHERLKSNKDNIELDTLKADAKYVKINKHLHQALIEKIESKDEDALSGEKTIRYLDEVIAGMSAPPEDFEEYEAMFSKIAPLDVNKFYEETSEVEIAVQPKQEADSGKKTLNEKFLKTGKTLMDEIARETKTSLLEIHQNKKINSIKNHITINQRFMFVNELFAGDANSFNTAIDGLETKQNYDEAMEFLINHLAKPNQWVMESEEVVEFLEVITKRFD